MKPGTLIFIAIVALLVWVWYNYQKTKSVKNLQTNPQVGAAASIDGNLAGNTGIVGPVITTRPALSHEPNLTAGSVLVEQEDMASGTVTTQIEPTVSGLIRVPVGTSNTFLRVVA